MSDLINIFNSKFDEKKDIGENNFYNNQKEIAELEKYQQKYTQNVDYSDPKNFARFGSAVEYYKNAINYISSEYPYDATTSKKYNWINSLNDLEFHIFKNEFPRHLGYISLSSSQNLEVYSHVKENNSSDTINYFNSASYYTNSTVLDFDRGITFEAWINFSNDTATANILEISAYVPSEEQFNKVDLFKILKNSGSNGHYFSVGNQENYYNFSHKIEVDKWHHYAFIINKSNIKLFVDGTIVETIDDIDINALRYTYTWVPLGLMLLPVSSITTYPDFNRSSVFKIGGGSKIYIDEVRLWNENRTFEEIGRYWFTNVDGNDYLDSNNLNLIFYFKFNEGWDEQYSFLCLDSSGRKNDSEIINFQNNCRVSGSAIIDSGKKGASDQPDIIIEGIKYSTLVSNFYDDKISSGSVHDSENMHMLYNKFPSWISEEEQRNDSFHLKNLIHVVCSYYDDLYNKIKEIVNYKDVNYTTDMDKIYPYYDKILTSMGFNVTPLFNDLKLHELISSRTDINIFENDSQKIKNTIYKNIYNNIAYILKSKGTEKSIKNFLKIYGVNENLVRLNIYPNNSLNDVRNSYTRAEINKKCLLATDSARISSQTFQEIKKYTLATSFTLSNDTPMQSNTTSSIFGLTDGGIDIVLTVEKESDNRNSFVFKVDGADSVEYRYTIDNYNIYDNTVWNACIRKKPNIDTEYGALDYDYCFDFLLINNNTHIAQQFSGSVTSNITGTMNYFIGAKIDGLSTVHKASSKFLYCNLWEDYLNNETINNHNKEIMNYGSS